MNVRTSHSHPSPKKITRQDPLKFQYCIIYFLDYTNITDKFGKTPIHMLVRLR